MYAMAVCGNAGAGELHARDMPAGLKRMVNWFTTAENAAFSNGLASSAMFARKGWYHETVLTARSTTSHHRSSAKIAAVKLEDDFAGYCRRISRFRLRGYVC